MKNGEAKLINGNTKLIRLRQVFTWALLIVSALSVSRVEALYYTTHRSRVNGPRSTSSSVGFGAGTSDRSKIQPIGNPNVVGQLCQDEEGSVIVRWPFWVNGGGVRFDEDSLAIRQYKSETDFLKVYVEKCQERDDKPDGSHKTGSAEAPAQVGLVLPGGGQEERVGDIIAVFKRGQDIMPVTQSFRFCFFKDFR